MAYRHNYLFEERVAEGRQRAYEASLALPVDATIEAWRDTHMAFVWRALRDRKQRQPHCGH